MDRQPVESSLIRSIGFDPVSSILEVELIEPRRVYVYYDVPFSVYDELMDAPSKGEYFNESIRDLYAYEERVDIPLSPSMSPKDDEDAAEDLPESFRWRQGTLPIMPREP
ncbi:MAG: KTSC domain-containing protein [Isosphaeraceae bacterium]